MCCNLTEEHKKCCSDLIVSHQDTNPLPCKNPCPSTPDRYKERLPSKCFQERVTNKERFSDALNGQRWRFLKTGLDDFRNGCPAPSDNIIIQGKKGPVPIILHYKKADASLMVPYKAPELQTRSDVIYSKLSATKKAKKDYIAQTERCLAQHPLALYPHLEESVPQELFHDVMGLLDPEMHLTRSSAKYSKTEENLSQYQLEGGVKPETCFSPTVPSWLPKRKNPYTWLSEKEVAEREKAAKIAYIPPLDENVKRVTKEFCEWVSAMGGENYNIDEATIMKLFDTRYETKAKTSAAPIKIVEMYHMPGELRECVGQIPTQESIKTPLKTHSEPKVEKIKYGAWYLPPKKWKKKKGNERDEIPECLQVFLNQRKKTIQKAQDEGLPLHGTYAFDKFLETKGYRKPEDRAVLKSPSFGDLIEKAETLQKNKEEKEAPRFASKNLKKLQEDKIKQFKKALRLPPITSDMKIPHPSYLNF